MLLQTPYQQGMLCGYAAWQCITRRTLSECLAQQQETLLQLSVITASHISLVLHQWSFIFPE
jgi:hypothetical protein